MLKDPLKQLVFFTQLYKTNWVTGIHSPDRTKNTSATGFGAEDCSG
mgnify:CR=1 FL=1